MNMKIFQIYYKPETRDQCDPAFTPLDNTANPRPQLCEWGVWDQVLSNYQFQDNQLIGFVSWKFREKTNLTGQQFVDFITANPGYDVYFVNPCIVNEAVFVNSWEQGDIHHPNISAIGNSFLTKVGYEDVSVRDIVLDRTRTMFANYLVGTRDFWDRFMQFSNKLFTEADRDADFKHKVFGAGLSNYAHDKSLPNFTFLIERLIPTFIELEGFNALPYQYTAETAAAKYLPHFGDISALSDLKVLINRHESDELYAIWNHYRHKFLKDNPGILGLE